MAWIMATVTPSMRSSTPSSKSSFDSSTSPNAFWVPLADLDFDEGAPVKKLTLAGGKVYSGNAASAFEEAKPFGFMPVEVT